MAVTLPFLSRFLVLSVRRHGLSGTNEDTALMLDTNQWTLPSGANGGYSAEHLHQLVANVAAESNAGAGPDLLWLLVADAHSSGVWTAVEVAESFTMFHRADLPLHPRLLVTLLYQMGAWGTPSFCLLF